MEPNCLLNSVQWVAFLHYQITSIRRGLLDLRETTENTWFKFCFLKINHRVSSFFSIYFRSHYSHTLLCLILGGNQTANFRKKKTQVHLIFMREWLKNKAPILKHLDNVCSVLLYSTPAPTPLQLYMKEEQVCGSKPIQIG